MRRLSPNEYATIKQLLNIGHSANKVAEIVGRSQCIVSTVKKTMSYAEYIEQRRAQARRAEENRKARQLPLDAPKKTTLDLREDITIKFNGLIESIDMVKRSTCTGPANFKQEIAYSRAKVHLEEARLWLKEAL